MVQICSADGEAARLRYPALMRDRAGIELPDRASSSSMANSNWLYFAIRVGAGQRPADGF